MRTLKNVAGGWKIVWLKTKRRSSDRKQQSFELKVWLASPVESTDKSSGGDNVSREPSGVASSSAPASSTAAAERFQSDEIPDHGVNRARWSPHVDASDVSPGDVKHSQEHAQEHSRGSNDNQSPRRMIWKTPVIKVMPSENWDECENDEESYVDDVNGGFVDPEMVRVARVEGLAGYLKMQVYCCVPVAECGSHKVIQTSWVDTKPRGRTVSTNSLPFV